MGLPLLLNTRGLKGVLLRRVACWGWGWGWVTCRIGSREPMTGSLDPTILRGNGLTCWLSVPEVRKVATMTAEMTAAATNFILKLFSDGSAGVVKSWITTVLLSGVFVWRMLNCCFCCSCDCCCQLKTLTQTGWRKHWRKRIYTETFFKLIQISLQISDIPRFWGQKTRNKQRTGVRRFLRWHRNSETPKLAATKTSKNSCRRSKPLLFGLIDFIRCHPKPSWSYFWGSRWLDEARTDWTEHRGLTHFFHVLILFDLSWSNYINNVSH